MDSQRKRVALVQKGIWDMTRESMPLAAGYFKAMIESDADTRRSYQVDICNFGGGATLLDMARVLLLEAPAVHVLGFSVLGWNFDDFCKLAELAKQLHPDVLTIFGGNHVTDQGSRVLQRCPAVDVVVNGEGELTIVELLRAYAAPDFRAALPDIAGITYRASDGSVRTTTPRPRIVDLDVIPSPILTGAIELRTADGQPRYDVVLLETNRGCPYSCSFCYWGGATGQKVRKFSPDRLRRELEFCAEQQVERVILCDANFGMFREDEDFVDTFIEVRQSYGYPLNFDTSWAKNKGPVFYRILEKMKGAGLHSAFTLALQSLSPAALTTMRRRNMKVNDWEDLVERLNERGMDSYAELIWGIPGETRESFLAGYDELALKVSRVAVYSHLILPNTEFYENRQDYGLVLIRGADDDFEYVLQHESMTFDENRRMHAFLFWARVIGEHRVLRHIWKPAHNLAGLKPSALLASLDAFMSRQTDPLARDLTRRRDRVVDRLDTTKIKEALLLVHRQERLHPLLRAWWVHHVLPNVSGRHRALLADVLEYDLVTMPVAHAGPDVTVLDDDHYVRRDIAFQYDVPQFLEKPGTSAPEPEPVIYDITFRRGFEHHIDSHELVEEYAGRPIRRI